MKTMKKIFSLLLALTMALALSIPAAAAGADLSGHTYKAYQIFSGTQGSTGAELGNIAWGSGVDSAKLLAALKAEDTFATGEGGETANAFADCITAADVAKVMANWADNSEKALKFAELAFANKKGGGTACTSGETTLNAGYYLVVDTTQPTADDENFVSNLALLQLTRKGTFDIQTKVDVPEVEKKVRDKNDSTGAISDWQDSADYDIGDSVPFRLTAAMPATLVGYETYKVVFHDTLSKGLAFNENSISVKVDDTDKTGSFNITSETDTATGVTTLTIACEDVMALGAAAGSTITVNYTAELTDAAVIGGAGNANAVRLEYSNNPNGEGTGKTPEDKVVVYTYQVVINKTDESGAPLAGAKFELFKKVKDSSEAGFTWKSLGVKVADKVMNGEEVVSYTADWNGLDDGDYKLVETVTPAGYNTMDDQFFAVSAAHTDGAEPTLDGLFGTKAANSEIVFAVNKSAGSLSSDIINQKGATLPETGGIGTTIFYTLGGTLLLGAAVLLITRKRMGAEE